MADISKLAGIGDQEIKKLHDKQINTIDDLWARVGAGFNDKGELRADIPIEKDRLIILLAAQGVREADQAGTPWPRRHWLDLALILSLVILILLIARAASAFVGAPRPLGLYDAVVVSKDKALAPFHVIGPDEVTQQSMPHAPGTFSTKDDVVGRYTLQAIPANTTLRTSQLSAARLSQADLADRAIISTSIKTGAISPAIVPGARVALVLSPRQPTEKGTSPLVVQDTILLAIDKQGDTTSITVAVKASELAQVAPLLGSSEVFVSQPAP
jgi:SAF domain-containing protein